MQIRMKGYRYYLLRAAYDPTKKRSVQTVIGSSNTIGDLVLHEGVTLTEAEQKEWDDHMTALGTKGRERGVRVLVWNLGEIPLDALTLETGETLLKALTKAAKGVRKRVKELTEQGTPRLSEEDRSTSGTNDASQ